jgi:DNA polymerase-1
MVARYLINSGANNNVTYSNVVSENLLDDNYMAYNMFVLKKKYLTKMEELEVKEVFDKIEMPLIDVLFNMETQGVKIDRAELESLEVKYRDRLDDLTAQIYEMAGKTFNVNSPKQLAEVLFDDLGISTKFNKKRSTSAQVLSDIYNDHPIVALITEYRQINKLYTTYIVAYKDLLDDNDKIYTVFNQTLTATGRLSSSEPNLQNIPVRTPEGRNLRKLFIPSTPGGKIVDADYNQIELRLLASFCGDEKLIKTYNDGKDIHASTASEIFGVPLEDVTADLRRNAKAINFGIVYGISDYGLGQNIGISRAEANNYIKKYFERYPKIEEYMKSNVEYCKAHGFVKTYYGRVRFIPEINSSNFMQRAFGERAAMNMPLQGTASDIIKLAMIGVYNELKNRGLKSKLIIQVHDELVIDAVKEEVTEVEKLLKDVMERIADLEVKLLVGTEVGNNWNEAH